MACSRVRSCHHPCRSIPLVRLGVYASALAFLMARLARGSSFFVFDRTDVCF